MRTPKPRIAGRRYTTLEFWRAKYAIKREYETRRFTVLVTAWRRTVANFESYLESIDFTRLEY